ncbi:hypothetical protein C7999DRAFT_36254 [Corynascus novoguineensis]|uniref:Oxidoreductase AflY n=1 Tax=Corynascus novoguineensis TaxID=1126955 RepID=A0AAN7HB82_9PEZI|nr:hypothetical protein C7999DRAFT_36254 [Corynascus novoguineensis]
MPGLDITEPASKPEDFTLPGEALGLGRLSAKPDQPGIRELISDLLHKNHEKYHMYFRDVAGHNHIPHAVLTTLAMGGGLKDIRRAYDDGEGIQRPKPQPDPKVVDEMTDPFKFLDRMQDIEEYSNFLAFFEKEIAAKGSWQAVVNEYVFARHPQSDFLLAQVFEGLYHPLIHIGFGIEFELPGLVAEGLAQAASHDPMYIDVYFQRSERLAQKGTIAPKPLAEIYREVRANDAIRTAPRLPDGPWKVRDGILGRSMEEIIQLAAQVQVKPTEADIERAMAEMISCAAWTCGSCQKPGKERKIDFFLMHNMTASLMLTVLCRQPWIKIEDKARLVEYKTRLDLVWYAASAAPEIVTDYLVNYEPKASKGMDWRQLYDVVNRHHDDGHVAKFVRACKNGEDVCLPFEQKGDVDFLPVKGGQWLKLAQMCYDTTHKFVDGQKKWVWGAGFDPMWKDVQDSEE